jgi:glycosyltransferase involved in cell wall biosynthesis
MKKITIIMPYLNEENETIETIKSIYETAPKDLFEIIAIDDNSSKAVPIKGFTEVKNIRNKTRIGVDGSRQLGVELAETPYVFIIDAHMRFKKDNWLEKMINLLEREPETAWCTVCLGLGYGNMDINKYAGKYYGADMLMINKNTNPNIPSREVLEPKWTSPKSGNEWEIPCILGANYGFSKKWFDHIRGLKGLQMWGTSEPFLSIKSWLAGGKCKVTTDIEIGHKFRDNAPYATGVNFLVYNKIFLCKTILPDEIGNKLIDCLPKDANYHDAMKRINNDKEMVEENRKYYSGIFKKNIYDYCSMFNIDLP